MEEEAADKKSLEIIIVFDIKHNSFVNNFSI